MFFRSDRKTSLDIATKEMSYPGSKAAAGVWQRIIGQMPPHSIYVEPFFGSGHVYRMKRPALVNYLIDINGAVHSARTDAGRGAHYIVGDAFEWLKRFGTQPQFKLNRQAVVYCDPPYLLQTRQNRRYYAEELSDRDHEELLKLLNRLKCNVLISHPRCDLYNRSLAKWRCIPYEQMTRGARTMPDALWCNFAEPETLHDWRYAGNNYRERLYLSRLKKRWLAKLANHLPRRRGFLLNAIKESYL